MNSIVLVVLMVCALAVVLLARKESLHGRGDKSKAGKGAGATKKKGAAGKPSRAASDVEILPPSEAPTSPFQRPPRVIVVDLPPLRPAR